MHCMCLFRIARNPLNEYDAKHKKFNIHFILCKHCELLMEHTLRYCLSRLSFLSIINILMQIIYIKSTI